MGNKKKKTENAFLMEAEYRLFLILPLLVRALSLKQAYALANVCAWFFYLLDFKHRKRAIAHILHSGIRTTLPEARALAKANFRHMVKVFVEVVKFDQIVTPENFREHLRYASDSPELDKIMDPEHPVTAILASAHLGNWELAGNIYTMFSGQNLCSIMRPLANRKLGEYFYAHRMSRKHTTVSKEKGIRPLLAALNRGDSIAVVSDQHATSREGVEITFFGHPARAHMTVALLHLKTGTPLAMPYLIRTGNFKFEFHCPEPISYTPTGDKERDVRNLTQLYTIMIEKEIRRFPEQWLWAHRRWLDCERGHDDYQIPPEQMPEVLLKGKEDTP